jgi:hypothetical protein
LADSPWAFEADGFDDLIDLAGAFLLVLGRRRRRVRPDAGDDDQEANSGAPCATRHVPDGRREPHLRQSTLFYGVITSATD